MSYKTAEPPCGWLERVELRMPGTGDEAAQALERGRVLGECTNLARELSNEPGNVLTPREFADRAEKMGKEAGLGVEILDETEIARLGMGLLLGVARGSHQPPRVVVLRHEPKNAVKGVGDLYSTTCFFWMSNLTRPPPRIPAQ
jgi:leucyl aminopeptidase